MAADLSEASGGHADRTGIIFAKCRSALHIIGIDSDSGVSGRSPDAGRRRRRTEGGTPSESRRRAGPSRGADCGFLGGVLGRNPSHHSDGYPAAANHRPPQFDHRGRAAKADPRMIHDSIHRFAGGWAGRRRKEPRTGGRGGASGLVKRVAPESFTTPILAKNLIFAINRHKSP